MPHRYVFYALNNKAVYENYFCFLLGLYSFTKTGFLEPQSAHIELCAINLFTTSFGMIDLLSVLFLQFK